MPGVKILSSDAGRAASNAETAIDQIPAASARAGAQSLAYVVGVLTLVNTLNHLDRQIISILAEPIRLEFALADWEVGILTGLSFALLYGLASLPLAHFADRANRSRLIASCLAVWSLFTALGGLAQSYVQLLLSRVVVGVAEAGGSAPSHALITELAPRTVRATALAVFSLGIPIGSFFGMALGGLITDTHGWRIGMLVAGAPGILLALLLFLTVRDPREDLRARRISKSDRGAPFTRGDFLKKVGGLLRVVTFRNITLGGACITFVNYSQTAFLASFFFRSHSEQLGRITAAELAFVGLSFGASAFLGVVLGAAKGIPGVIGTLWGGRIADKLSIKTLQSLAVLPAVTAWLRIPLIFGVFLSPTLELALAFVVLQAFVIGVGAPAGFASVQGLAHPDTRALAASIYLFTLNLVGLGFGPLLVGLLSDALQSSGATAGEGLRWSLIVSGSLVLAVGGWFKWRARRSIEAEIVS